jgi:hypothetical protein
MLGGGMMLDNSGEKSQNVSLSWWFHAICAIMLYSLFSSNPGMVTWVTPAGDGPHKLVLPFAPNLWRLHL